MLISGYRMDGPCPQAPGRKVMIPPRKKQGRAMPILAIPAKTIPTVVPALPFGMMYGSFMNYFDDRALFMFSDGHRKRVEGCIELYRPDLLTSDGATPPVAVTDAFMVNVTPRGTPERPAYLVNNTAFTANVRNTGTTDLTSVTLNVKVDGVNAGPVIFPLALAPGEDTTLNLSPITGSPGTHAITVYTSAPNGTTDTFSDNDTLISFIFINAATITAPFTQDFSSGTFPPAGWNIWNPNGNITWESNDEIRISLCRVLPPFKILITRDTGNSMI